MLLIGAFVDVLGIGNNKSPGPDGFTSFFLEEAWSIVKADVVEAVNYLPRHVNATIIALIPKTRCPNTPTDFRLIACANVLYKCISKILTMRIKVTDKLVSLQQGAFIKCRSIMYNVILAQELLNGYGTKSLSPRYVMMVELRKAYDSVS